MCYKFYISCILSTFLSQTTFTTGKFSNGASKTPMLELPIKTLVFLTRFIKISSSRYSKYLIFLFVNLYFLISFLKITEPGSELDFKIIVGKFSSLIASNETFICFLLFFDPVAYWVLYK